VQKINSLVLTIHKLLVIDWLAYVHDILQPAMPLRRRRPWAFAYNAYAIIRPCVESLELAACV